MKRIPWTEEEVKLLESNLDKTIFEIIEAHILDRTYWQIYNRLALSGYRYSFKEKRWTKGTP